MTETTHTEPTLPLPPFPGPRGVVPRVLLHRPDRSLAAAHTADGS